MAPQEHLTLPRDAGIARELTKDDRAVERDAVLVADCPMNTDINGYCTSGLRGAA